MYRAGFDAEPQPETRLGVTSQRPLFSVRIVTMYWKGALLDTVALTVCSFPDVSKLMVCEATKTAIKSTSLMILLLCVPVFIAHPDSIGVQVHPNLVCQ